MTMKKISRKLITCILILLIAGLIPVVAQKKTKNKVQESLYPSYNISPLSPDSSGMSSNAVQLAAKIKLGFNIGNTLEATGGENAWGNPNISAELIDLIKKSGFNAIRLPCAWDQYVSNQAKAKIGDDWLKRVKEVVQMCVERDMYVLLNIHWDGGWLDQNIKPEMKKATIAKQRAFWEQIATQMRDFDEHVLFCSANEPPVEDQEQMAILSSYHQTFVDAVRSTGGRNSYRVLVIQGPGTDIEKTMKLMLSLPKDNIPSRLMLEMHYYGPWQFCGLTEDADWGRIFYYWGKPNQSTTDSDRNPSWDNGEDYVERLFKSVKKKYVDNGIPVVMGEYGTIRRTYLTGESLKRHEESRAYWSEYITRAAIANGLLPFYWDEGSISNHGFGILDRKNNTVFDTQVLDALIAGAAK
jgi:endoglucanase